MAAGSRTDDFVLDLDEVKRVVDGHDPVITFLCSPNNPTGRAETPEQIEAVVDAAPGLVVVDEAYGQFAAVLARSTWCATGARAPSGPWWSGPFRRRGRWPGSPRLPGGSAAGGRGVRAGGPSLPPRRGQAVGRPAGPALRRRDGDTGGHAERGAGPDGRSAGRAARRQLALGRQLHPVPAHGGGGHGRYGQSSSTPPSSCETVRSGRASPGASGSRWVSPRRTTASWPH